ncbi:hypothetical protein SAMN05660657_02635 [Geodermatophilus amargosae]|uniref:Uncharacterized protein n=1 Tax=Geodermatophilus amargosae TaxID=1296565 RepID=A0A1I7ABU0_9ACTN|nr:hypothetical protein [Geodermatophilus amargosae]SFT72373.1 hypothetical protein SAMN05660657_02635 [Geodermatophilus amargosae]
MRRALPCAVAVTGAALAVAGITVLWWTNTQAPTVTHDGSHAPLLLAGSAHESTLTVTSDGGSVLWDPGHLVGAGLLVAGALVLAAVGGWALGRRSARRGTA